MNLDIDLTDVRNQTGSVVTPWEFALFKQLSVDSANASRSPQIDIDVLVDAYRQVMEIHGLSPLSREWIIKQLESGQSGPSLIERDGGRRVINYSAYNKTLRWFMSMRKHYGLLVRVAGEITDTIVRRPRINWHRHGIAVLTSVADAVAVFMIVFAKLHIPRWLIVARAFAAIILMNILYILIPLTGMSAFIPDRVLAQLLPLEHADGYHSLYGIKILLASVLHAIAHVMQIHTAINKCVGGCMRADIRIVPPSKTQTVISYGYFFKEFPYLTGIVLMLLLGSAALSMILYQHRWIRWSTNRAVHQYIAVAGIAMTIVHGCAQLLAFNYSFVLTLPALAAYGWRRRHLVAPHKIKISRWVITPTTLRLYMRDNKRFDEMLNSFENVIVYVNHPKVSRAEWHPFTLSRGYNSTESTITMKRVGNWTNVLADRLQRRVGSSDYIGIGHYERSKFRFHKLYRIRYFFCAGIGITGFMAAVSDMLRTSTNATFNTKYRTVLVWSVADPNIVVEFGRHLRDIQQRVPNVKILIFYSNRAKAATKVIPYDIRARFLYLQALIFGICQTDIAIGSVSPICIVFQRVDFMEILSRAVLSIKAQPNVDRNPVGIFICGPATYAQHVIVNVNRAERNQYGVTFRVWSESV